MDPISHIDRLVVLFRQKLRERARASAGKRTSGSSGTKPSSSSTSIGIGSLAEIGNVDDETARRVVIQGLLADQFGTAILNDAQFQTVISRVTEAIQGDKDAARLLAAVVDELRKA